MTHLRPRSLDVLASGAFVSPQAQQASTRALAEVELGLAGLKSPNPQRNSRVRSQMEAALAAQAHDARVQVLQASFRAPEARCLLEDLAAYSRATAVNHRRQLVVVAVPSVACADVAVEVAVAWECDIANQIAKAQSTA